MQLAVLVLQQSDELRGESVDISYVAQPPMATLSNHFRDAPDSRRHDRQADRSCLQEDPRQSFPMRCEQKRIE